MSVEQVGLKQKWDNLSQGKKTAIIAGGTAAAAAVGTTIAAGIKGGKMVKAINEGAKDADKFEKMFKDGTNFKEVGMFKKIGAGYKAFFKGIQNWFHKLFNRNDDSTPPKDREEKFIDEEGI